MRYVPASPGGMTIRSTCGPRSSRTAALCPPRLTTWSTTPERGEPRRSAPAASSVSASRSRSPIVSRLRRNEPAGSDRGRRACRRGRHRCPRSIVSAWSRSIRSGVDLEPGDALEDERLGPRRHPAQVRAGGRPRRPRAGRRSSRCRALVELADGLGPEPRDPQQLDEAGRDLRAQPVVVAPCGRSSRARAILSLIAAPDARDARRRPRPVGAPRGRPGCARSRRPRGGRRRS